ncbi:MAG: hypothetical protein AB7V50_08525, partial [Vampirovibrionia bacterium]
MTDQFENQDFDDISADVDYSQPVQLPYDGANVTSSHPFTNALNQLSNDDNDLLESDKQDTSE